MDANTLAKKHFSKIVDLDNNQGAGAYGKYLRLSSKYGAKVIVLKSGHVDGFKRFTSLRELKKSDLWKVAREEVKCLIKARAIITRKCMVPICYGVAPVKVILSTPAHDEYEIGDRVVSWLPAIFMEHINGVPLSNSNEFDDDHMYKVEQFFDLHGINNQDIHDDNIIVRPRKTKYKTRFVVIDWTSEHVHFNDTGIPDFI